MKIFAKQWKVFHLFVFCFVLAALGLSCSLWDLVP